MCTGHYEGGIGVIFLEPGKEVLECFLEQTPTHIPTTGLVKLAGALYGPVWKKWQGLKTKLIEPWLSLFKSVPFLTSEIQEFFKLAALASV